MVTYAGVHTNLTKDNIDDLGFTMNAYNKTTLPLEGRETGTSVAVLASGTLLDEYTRGLNYDGYVVGGVSFLTNDEERSGVFLRTVSDMNMRNR